MSILLTDGAIETVMAGGTVDNPILQILGSKKLMNNGMERYRLLISDGRHINSFTMIASQLNDLVSSGQLSEYTIIKVKRHISSVVNGANDKEKRVMVILELEILKKGSEVGVRLGNPVPYEASSVGGGAAPAAAPSAPARPPPSAPSQRQTPSANGYGNQVRMSPAPPGPNATIHPISSLNPYQNRWTIKARVTSKPPIRTYTNARGNGKLFNVVFADETGEIKCTAFNNTVDKFYDIIEVGKVYMVSNCTLKAANKQFTNADYEMTFQDESHVIPCADNDVSLPKTIYNFVSVQKIAEMPTNQMLDFIGVAQTIGDVMTLTSRNTGKELKKREVLLVDQSNQSVALTLWDPLSSDFQGNTGDVIAAKNVVVNEFMGGKSISTRFQSTVEINPDIEEAHRLRGWYDNGGASCDVQSISAKGPGQSSSGNWMMLSDVSRNGLGMGDKADYFSSVVTVLMARAENCFYRACPGDNCKKKVMDMNNGHFRCEKCNREFDSFLYRLLVNVHVSDCTGSQWVTLFHEEAEKLLKISGQTLGAMIDNRDESYKDYFLAANFQPYQMKFRCKFEQYNDESRLKFSVVNVDPYDPKAYARRLLTAFKNEEGIRRGA